MRKLTILSLAALSLTTVSLTACGSQSSSQSKSEASDGHVTKVETKSDINGVKTVNRLELSHYAVRAALGQNPNTAAYVTVKNTGQTDDRLISAACDCAETVELHTMKMDGDKMMMSAMPEGFVIKAGETLELKPGGNHIMLLGLKTRPADGGVQSLTLTFEKAGPVTIEAAVSNTPLSGASASTPEHSGH
ncbi:MAG: copper chaperone PCu(A)C [Asticcacaulis sp.]